MMTKKEVVLNETVYTLLIDYARNYEKVVGLKEEAAKLAQQVQSQVIESIRATNWEFRHTIAEEITAIEHEIAANERELLLIEAEATFDIRYLTELKYAKFKANVENYYVWKQRDQDGKDSYHVENVETGSDETFSTREEVAQHLLELYPYLNEKYEDALKYVMNRINYV